MLARRWDIRTPNPGTVLALSAKHKVSHLVATVMVNRGLTEGKSAARYLNPSLSTLSNPSVMAGMPEASARFADAIENGQVTVLAGDYDCDGCAGLALMLRFCHLCGYESNVHIPQRSEGYGFHRDSLQILKDQYNPSLIITVDVGISAFDTALLCRDLGIDLIITDHHTCGESLPEAIAVLNPHRSDCPYPFKALSGAGVAFALCSATTRLLIDRGYFAPGGEPDLRELLPLVALATIADLVDLQGENRALVFEGLKLFHMNTGLRALARASGLDPLAAPTAGQVGFKLAPLINASGRMDSAMLACELLSTDDEARADELAQMLFSFNKERQEIEAEMVATAIATVEATPSLLQRTLVLFGEHNHAIQGIVASRLTERFHRPTVMLADMGDGTAKGSARSIKGFHLYDALAEVSDLLKGFGGHPAAAGLTLDVANIENFRAAFDATEQARSLSEEDLVPVIEIDAIATSEDLDLQTIDDLKCLQPFGMSNKGPVFCIQGATVVLKKVIKEKHLKLKLEIGGQSFDAIGWGMAEVNTGGRKVDIAFTMEENIWQNTKSVQLVLKDIKQAGVARSQGGVAGV